MSAYVMGFVLLFLVVDLAGDAGDRLRRRR